MNQSTVTGEHADILEMLAEQRKLAAEQAARRAADRCPGAGTDRRAAALKLKRRHDRVLAQPLDRLEPVEVPLAGGLDDLPRHALLAVVQGSGRPDHLACEAAAVRLELELFVVELEIHLGPPRGCPAAG